MEKLPKLESHEPQTLSPSNSERRRNNDPNSPEFEFWMVRNPSFPQPHLLSADKLIVDGVLLPLDLLPHEHPSEPPDSDHQNPKPNPNLEAESESSSTVNSSKRWRDIFKMGEKKTSTSSIKTASQEDKREKKKDRKSSSSSSNNSGSSGAELNINIWPFSRSWSGGNRPKMGIGSVNRKVSSAPCSRSNSAGESKSRKWPNSPSRGGGNGIHLGRSSPVWQVRRGGSGLRNSSEPVVRNVVKTEGLESRRSKSSGGGVLNLNVPMCIGYRQQLSCRNDENVFVNGGGVGGDGGGGGSNGGGGGGVGVGGNKLFNLRTLFTKKVY